jgi:hypothetical protein
MKTDSEEKCYLQLLKYIEKNYTYFKVLQNGIYFFHLATFKEEMQWKWRQEDKTLAILCR